MSNKIYTVIGKMQSYITFFQYKPEYNHLIPFLHTYRMVTEQVALHNMLDQNFYEDFDAISDLDKEFANLYFTPLESHLKELEVNAPWESYFEYCKSRDNSPFLQLLLGINAHINADLAHAMIKSNYTNESDYFKVNSILLEVVPKLMNYLLFSEADFLGLGGLMLQKFFTYEFTNIIVDWRNTAWENSQKIRSKKLSQDELNEATNKLGFEITRKWMENYNIIGIKDLLVYLNTSSKLTL